MTHTPSTRSCVQPKQSRMAILVTGGAGFIGSHFVERCVDEFYPDDEVVVLDLLPDWADNSAGRIENLLGVLDRITLVRGDICDKDTVQRLLEKYEFSKVVNFAANTHVDYSLSDPLGCLRTNIEGVAVLLEAVRKMQDKCRMIQCSTDEIYGSAPEGVSFKESDVFNPSSPYSASKAGAEMVVNAYRRTYGLDTVITRSSNCFGERQEATKFIPRAITETLKGNPIPVFAEGRNIRDWLYVGENCEAINLVAERGEPGEAYNIGGECEVMNIDVATDILSHLRKKHKVSGRIEFVKDRPGHDFRYSISNEKIMKLGWKPRHEFHKALDQTVDWYVKNRRWWEKPRILL
jgi:dTDP-glucose 4,6-dehydratase